ncbi:MAG TPA: hypothetical protein VK669_14435, partial [Candidatus Limnocylindrales bacterium]|nr:hypothetical protein [Candidatus Limnocylindrales bacterium]
MKFNETALPPIGAGAGLGVGDGVGVGVGVFVAAGVGVGVGVGPEVNGGVLVLLPLQPAKIAATA